MTFYVLFFMYLALCGYLQREKRHLAIAITTVLFVVGAFSIPLEQPTPTQIQVPTTKGR